MEDTLQGACAGGEVDQPDGDRAQIRRQLVQREGAPLADLRDVVFEDGVLFVSRFRSAQVLTLDPVTWALRRLEQLESGAAAWRMRPSPDLGVIVLYQSNRDGLLMPPSEGGAYSGGP